MLLVIIPAYKPDDTLIKLIGDLEPYDLEKIVVDDGSGEEHEHIFNAVEDRCIVLRHEENRGKGAAIKTALGYIKDKTDGVEAIGVMDSDGQHLPEDMMKLLAAASLNKEALVLGVRAVGKDMPTRSRLGNKITRNVFRMVSGVAVSDTQTGLRAFSPELVERLLSIEGERYEYEMNVLIKLAKEGVPIKEIPISTIYHDKKNSVSHFRSFRDSARIYKDIIKFSLSSLSSFVLDYILFTAIMLIVPHISAMYNYSMNCRFVFREKRRLGTALQYFALAGFILIMNNLILEFFTQILDMSVYPAKLLTECMLFVMSWLIQNFIIFRKGRTVV